MRGQDIIVSTNRVASGGWTPADDANGQDLWLSMSDTDSYTVDASNNLTSITDKSHRANAISIVGTSAVTASLNSISGIDFASAASLTTPDQAYFDYTDGVFLFAVASMVVDGASWNGIISKGDDAYQLRRYSNTEDYSFTMYLVSPYSPQITASDTTINSVLVANYDRINRIVRQNGAEHYNQSVTSAMYTDTSEITISRGSGQTKIWEVIIAPPKDIETVQKYEGWAAHTYGLTASLPASHSYKNSAP